MQDTQDLTKSVKIETSLLKAMSQRHTYDLYSDSINKKRVLETTIILLEDYKKYYDLYPEHDRIDFSIFFTQFSQTWHASSFDDDTISYYRDYVFPAIEKAEDSEAERSLLGLLQKQTLDKLNESAKKDFDVNVLSDLLESYRSQQSQIIKEYDNDSFDINNIDFSVLDKKTGIPWFLPSLQAGLGSLVKGQFVLVSADTGTGKSAFVLCEAVATFLFLHKTGDTRPILYFNSEGTEADVYLRFLSNLYKEKIRGGFESVLNNIDRVRESFNKTYDTQRFLVYQIANNNWSYVKNKIHKHNPALVIIDICDVLASEETPQILKKLYDNLRLTSGLYCPIIGTTQSGNTEYLDKETGQMKSVKMLGSKSLYGSKTGKGGAADTIITIGKESDDSNLRYINTPKKKRGVPVKITCELQDIYSNYKE